MEFGVEMALKGSWREAAFRFERVVQEDPENAYAWNNLGVALESTGRFDEARAAYEKALELDPKNDRMEENLGRLKAYAATRSQPGFSAASPKGQPEAGKAEAPAAVDRKDDGS
jgi:superkiller protein 3